MIGFLLGTVFAWFVCNWAYQPRINESMDIRNKLAHVIHEDRAEIDHLRLTNGEREAIQFFAAIDSNDVLLGAHATTLRRLLERLGEER